MEFFKILKGLPHSEQEPASSAVTFAMEANGYIYKKGKWQFSEKGARRGGVDHSDVSGSLKNFQLTAFDPTPPGYIEPFFDENQDCYRKIAPPECVEEIFRQDEVANFLNNARNRDEQEARRVAFMLGGIGRVTLFPTHPATSFSKETAEENLGKAKEAVAFTARLAAEVGGENSEAIVRVLSLYFINGGTMDGKDDFETSLKRMATAVKQDDVEVRDTKDLGLSQLTRLTRYFSNEALPDIAAHRAAFIDLPTVGGEWHIPYSALGNRTLLQRLALLNLSQYHKTSSIQFSREDGDFIEIHMNPSDYPTAVATWVLMQKLVPEIKRSTFTLTLRPGEDNFNWESGNTDVITSLGALLYAATFDKPPLQKGNPWEGYDTKYRRQTPVTFGASYLGQAQVVKDRALRLEGHYGNEKGKSGQLALYLGIGDFFPSLAFYLSMVAAKSDLMDALPARVKDLLKYNNLEVIYELLNEKDKDGNPTQSSKDFATNLRFLFQTLSLVLEKDPVLGVAQRASQRMFGELGLTAEDLHIK